jgi:hypothetical protein
MRNIRWLKLVVTLAALGLITATGSAQAADVPAGSTSSPVLGYCSPAPQPAAGNALPKRLSAGELCSEASPAHATTAGAPVSVAAGWLAAIASREKLTANPAPFAAPELAWGDAGAGRR